MNRYHKLDQIESKGFYYLEHHPTGKVYTGTSTNMKKSLDEIITHLKQNTSTNKRLQRLYLIDPDFRVRIHPTQDIKEARSLEKDFRMERLSYLLLN